MIFALPLITLIIAFSIIPFFLSLFALNEFSLQQLINVIRDSSMRISMMVSLLYALVTITLSLGIGMRFAFRIFRMPERNQNLFLFLLFFTWMIPGFISIPIYRSVLYWFTESLVQNRVYAFSVTALVKIWINIPITTLISFASIKNIPYNQIEMMRIEGANKEQYYDYLLNPLTRSTLLSFSVILLINSFRDLSVPLMLTNGRPFLIEGFTPYGIAGATTTLGLFLKDSMLRVSSDFISYSQSLFVTLFILLLFVSIRKVRDKNLFYFLLAPLIDLFLFFNVPVFFGTLVFFLLFFIMKLKKRPFTMTMLILPLIFHALIMLELTPGLLFFALLLFFKPKELFDNRFLKLIWNKLCDLSMFFWIILTFLIFFNFLKLAFSNPLYIPDWNEFKQFTFTNFGAVFSDRFPLNLLNSTIIGLSSALLTLIIVFPAAYKASLKKGVFKKLNFLIVLSMVMTGMNTIVPLFLIFKLSGLLNSLFGVILIVVNHAIPIAFLIAYEDMQKIPPAYIENAKIEGATPFKTFHKVIFPQILPVTLIVFAKVMIDGWSSFTAPLIFITDQDKYPVSLRLYAYAGKDALMYPDWGKFAAGSLISLVILFLIIFPFRRILFKGVYRSWSEEQI